MNTAKRSLMKRAALPAALAGAATLLWIGWWNRAGAAGPTPTPAASPASASPAPGSPLPPSSANYGVSFTHACDWPWAGSGPTTPFGQGTYVEPGRTQHVPEYRLRVD